MSSLALNAPGFRPPSQERLGSGLLMAALAHALLIGALAIGLNWKLPSPEVVVAAELWSAVPQVAAPAPVAPPPPPPVEEAVAPRRPAPPPAPTAAERDAEIALEKSAQKKKEQALEAERQRKAAEEAARRELEAATLAQQKKLEARRLAEEKAAALKKEQQARDDKAKKEAAEQREREAKAQEALIAKQREENLKRMMGQAAAAGGGTGAPNANGNASRDGAPSAAYAGRIKARIKPNILLTTELAGNPVAEVEIRCSPDGGIIGSRIIKPSGNKAWDDIVQRAIDKTGSLPRDTDGRIPATMVLVFSPRD